MEFILEEVKTDMFAGRAEIKEGFFGGTSAIVKPNVYVLTFVSVDQAVVIEVSLPETHVFSDELTKLRKGRGEIFKFQML